MSGSFNFLFLPAGDFTADPKPSKKRKSGISSPCTSYLVDLWFLRSFHVSISVVLDLRFLA